MDLSQTNYSYFLISDFYESSFFPSYLNTLFLTNAQSNFS